MTTRWNEDAEPTAPTTLRKVTGIRIEPDGTARVILAPIPTEPVPYAEPDELQDGIVEPTAVFKPGESLPDWSNVEITVTYYD